MPAVRSIRAIVAAIAVVGFVLVPVTLRAAWVERKQPLAHALFVPKGYEASKKYPLVIVIHGNGWQGNNNSVYKGEFYAQHLAKPKIQDATPHFIYVPQCPGGQTWVGSPWEKGAYSVDKVRLSDSMTKMTTVLAGLLKEYSIDQDRLYVIGISMGGQATWDLVCRNPKMFAAAVPVCGCGDPSKAKLLGSMGIWAFHGSDDPTVPVKSDRGTMAELEKADIKVLRLNDADPTETPKAKHVYSEYKMGHNVWDKACGLQRFVVPWLFAQSLAANEKKADDAAKIDDVTLKQWSAPYRGWHYWPEPVVPEKPHVPGLDKFQNTDCPCVFQHYCSCGNKGRCIGLITSKNL